MITSIPIEERLMVAEAPSDLPTLVGYFISPYCGQVLDDPRAGEIVPFNMRCMYSFGQLSGSSGVFYLVKELSQTHHDRICDDMLALSEVWDMPKLKDVITKHQMYAAPAHAAIAAEDDDFDQDALFENCKRSDWGIFSLIFTEDRFADFLSERSFETRKALEGITAFKELQNLEFTTPNHGIKSLISYFKSLRAAQKYLRIPQFEPLDARFQELETEANDAWENDTDLVTRLEVLANDLGAMQLPIKNMMTFWPDTREDNGASRPDFEAIFTVLLKFNVMRRFNEPYLRFYADIVENDLVYSVPSPSAEAEVRKALREQYLPWTIPNEAEKRQAAAFYKSIDGGAGLGGRKGGLWAIVKSLVGKS